MISVCFDLLYRLAGMAKHSIETLQEKSPVVEECHRPNYSIPTQMELIEINRQLQEEISKLKSKIIELQEELLVKKKSSYAKDA